jgi:hypothetical protein
MLVPSVRAVVHQEDGCRQPPAGVRRFFRKRSGQGPSTSGEGCRCFALAPFAGKILWSTEDMSSATSAGCLARLVPRGGKFYELDQSPPGASVHYFPENRAKLSCETES